MHIILGLGKGRGKIFFDIYGIGKYGAFYGEKKEFFACCEAPQRTLTGVQPLVPRYWSGINGTMTSVPLWASTALQTAVSR